MVLPNSIKIREVGLREGLQICPQVVPLDEKLELVKMFNKTGVRELELASLVRADRVPQMADADELIANYERVEGVRYTALCLNTTGLERAVSSQRLDNKGWIYFSASETFLKKNNNLSFTEFFTGLTDWAETLKRLQLPLEGVMISNAFGCSYEGRFDEAVVANRIADLLRRLLDLGLDPMELSLADTVGVGNPKQVQSLVSHCRNLYPEKNVSLHLHDTWGLGLANAVAGMIAGVDTFECSVGGVGGCPFTKGSAGNIATEDLAFMAEQMGITTGIDIGRYCEISRRLEIILGPTALSGRYFRTAQDKTA